MVRDESGLLRAAPAEREPLAYQVLDGHDVGLGSGDEVGDEADVDVAHRDHPARLVEETLDLDVSQRAVPGQVDVAVDEGVHHRVVVRVQHPVQVYAPTPEDGLQTLEHVEVRLGSRAA